MKIMKGELESVIPVAGTSQMVDVSDTRPETVSRSEASYDDEDMILGEDKTVIEMNVEDRLMKVLSRVMSASFNAGEDCLVSYGVRDQIEESYTEKNRLSVKH